MKGWTRHAAACPRGCDSRPTAAARCSLSVYIMNSQQRRDRRAVNTWLQYQNTAAQVSRSIFTSRMADAFIPVTNCGTFFSLSISLFRNILLDTDFKNTPPPFLVCKISNYKTSWWCIWSTWHKHLVMKMISRSPTCSFNEPSLLMSSGAFSDSESPHVNKT